MNVNEIWCSICCRFMDEGCKKCSHFDEQAHLDQEDKVDTSPEHLPEEMKEGERRLTNFDKLLEDPENREIIMAAVSRKFCIHKNEMIVSENVSCSGCGFYEEHKTCDDVILEWLHEEYVEGGEG